MVLEEESVGRRLGSGALGGGFETSLMATWEAFSGNVSLQASMGIKCCRMGDGSCPSAGEAFKPKGGGIYSHLRVLNSH